MTHDAPGRKFSKPYNPGALTWEGCRNREDRRRARFHPWMFDRINHPQPKSDTPRVSRAARKKSKGSRRWRERSKQRNARPHEQISNDANCSRTQSGG